MTLVTISDETYREHVTQWLQLRRNMSRDAAAALVADNIAYLAAVHVDGMLPIRAASFIYLLA